MTLVYKKLYCKIISQYKKNLKLQALLNFNSNRCTNYQTVKKKRGCLLVKASHQDKNVFTRKVFYTIRKYMLTILLTKVATLKN